jgi:hypothetical protein
VPGDIGERDDAHEAPVLNDRDPAHATLAHPPIRRSTLPTGSPGEALVTSRDMVLTTLMDHSG